MKKEMSTKGKRLDLLLEEQGFCPSRQVARTAIMNGAVLVNGQKITKAGTLIKEGAKIELTSSFQNPKYVSRGGLKLEKALKEFKIDCNNRICMDIGASTGGFCDCLLKAGAAFVFAIDVGYGQLAWSLRTDSRVKVMERTNARNLSPEILLSDQNSELPSLAVIDVSFISLAKILPAVKRCLAAKASEIVALVKPQFEAGPEQVGKKGVVRSKEVHKQVISQVIADAEKLGLFASRLSFSPLKGPEGNIEFLLLLNECSANEFRVNQNEIDKIVELAQSL